MPPRRDAEALKANADRLAARLADKACGKRPAELPSPREFKKAKKEAVDRAFRGSPLSGRSSPSHGKKTTGHSRGKTEVSLPSIEPEGEREKTPARARAMIPDDTVARFEQAPLSDSVAWLYSTAELVIASAFALCCWLKTLLFPLLTSLLFF